MWSFVVFFLSCVCVCGLFLFDRRSIYKEHTGTHAEGTDPTSPTAYRFGMSSSHRVLAQQQSARPNLVPCLNLVLFASTGVCCARRPATRYWAAREPTPRMPTAFRARNACAASSSEESTKLKHGTKLGRTLCQDPQPEPDRSPGRHLNFNTNVVLGLHKILPLPILYSVCYTLHRGGRVGSRILRNSRAMLLQQ